MSGSETLPAKVCERRTKPLPSVEEQAERHQRAVAALLLRTPTPGFANLTDLASDALAAHQSVGDVAFTGRLIAGSCLSYKHAYATIVQ